MVVEGVVVDEDFVVVVVVEEGAAAVVVVEEDFVVVVVVVVVDVHFCSRVSRSISKSVTNLTVVVVVVVERVVVVDMTGGPFLYTLMDLNSHEASAKSAGFSATYAAQVE